MISYKVNNIEHKVTFCKSGNLGPISSSLDKINSDKNILLIYDDKINTKILKNIFWIKIIWMQNIQFKKYRKQDKQKWKILIWYFKLFN